MKSFRIRPGRPLRGRVRVPGDKSISHRAILFAALSEGTCVIRGVSNGLDVRATADAFASMGVRIDRAEITEVGHTATVRGVGLRGLRLPEGVIDCGNSGTTMRLLAGLLSAQRFGTRLVGDGSLSKRPMKRVIEPLRARGAHIAGTVRLDSEDLFPPISVAPLVEGESLIGLEHTLPQASAQVKTALLISGLYAGGLTALSEPVLSRDHTERMLTALGVPLERMGAMVVLDPSAFRGGWDAFSWDVPGDPSGAAFPIAAALICPGSDVTIEGVCVNPTRTGLLDALRAMGAGVAQEAKGEAAGSEPIADLRARAGALRSGLVAGEWTTRMIDEVPALCAIAAGASAKLEVRDAEELRVKESDRIALTASVIRAFGVPVEELPDGLLLPGGALPRGARVSSGGDHRIAMMAAILGLRAEGETIVDDVGCVETSFPGFVDCLRSLGADITAQGSP